MGSSHWTDLIIHSKPNSLVNWNELVNFLGYDIQVSLPNNIGKQTEVPQIVVGCISHTDHFNQRNEIRNTWAKESNSVIVWFILGEATEETIAEAEEYEDILIINIAEVGYMGLPIKVGSYFQIAEKYFPHTPWFMKADDDSSIYFAKLKDAIEQLSDPFEKNQLVGHIYTNARVIRDRRSKFFVPTVYNFRNNIYPAYPAGCAYLISNSLTYCVNGLTYSSATEYFRFDDVFIGLLAHKCGFSPFPLNDIINPSFSLENDSPIGLAVVHPLKKIGEIKNTYNLQVYGMEAYQNGLLVDNENIKRNENNNNNINKNKNENNFIKNNKNDISFHNNNNENNINDNTLYNNDKNENFPSYVQKQQNVEIVYVTKSCSFLPYLIAEFIVLVIVLLILITKARF